MVAVEEVEQALDVLRLEPADVVAVIDVALTTACGAGLGPPSRNSFLGEPDGEAARWRRAASYAAQFVNRYRCFGML